MNQASFRDRIATSLAQPGQEAFIQATDFLVQKRRQAFDDEHYLEQLRSYGEATRQQVLAQLPELLETLEQRCTENGIQVHWAKDAEQANSIIHDILQRNKVTQLVKGKSMVSEEIELNHYLESRGIECLESDMGEYIIQLANEAPSHIIMPAIHKNKQQIAKLFEKHLDIPYTEDVDQLIGAARRFLREKFAAAHAGITGVNFAIADTGTLCLVENEGNGRMSSTVPPIHIAVTGIEKVLPSLEQLPAMLSLLTRSATGQHITTYVNMISGPKKTGEKDGPEQVHLVLLDNGRSRIHGHKLLQPTLQCIRCGACMNHCPVYSRVGGHAYGTTYPGPIGQAVMPQIAGLEQHGDMVTGCSLNGACGEACPVRIPLPSIIRQLRAESVNRSPSQMDKPVLQQGAKRKAVEAWIWKSWAAIYKRPLLYRLLLTGFAMLKSLRLPLPPWTLTRDLPQPKQASLHAQLRRHQPGRSEAWSGRAKQAIETTAPQGEDHER